MIIQSNKIFFPGFMYNLLKVISSEYALIKSPIATNENNTSRKINSNDNIVVVFLIN